MPGFSGGRFPARGRTNGDAPRATGVALLLPGPRGDEPPRLGSGLPRGETEPEAVGDECRGDVSLSLRSRGEVLPIIAFEISERRTQKAVAEGALCRGVSQQCGNDTYDDSCRSGAPTNQPTREPDVTSANGRY